MRSTFARDYSLPAEHLFRYREATAGRLPVSSLLIPIQTGERTLGVLLLDNFNTTAAFTADDEALLLSLTQQVALSLENVRLVQASQERAIQLQALTDVSADYDLQLEIERIGGRPARPPAAMSYPTIQPSCGCVKTSACLWRRREASRITRSVSA